MANYCFYDVRRVYFVNMSSKRCTYPIFISSKNDLKINLEKLYIKMKVIHF